MDPTTAVRTDAFPAIATMVIPGAVASAPFAWLVLAEYPKAATYLSGQVGLATFLAAIVCVGAGLAIESFGSYVEVGIEHWRGGREQLLEDWWKYLCLSWEHPPIGQSYLRRQLIIFKFELNSVVAVFFAMFGVIALGYRGLLSDTATIWMVIGLFALFWAALKAACDSSKLLADVRSALLKVAKSKAAPKPMKVWRSNGR